MALNRCAGLLWLCFLPTGLAARQKTCQALFALELPWRWHLFWVLVMGVFMADQPQWLPTETAPKDRMILADVGMPWAAVATWSEYAEKWVLAELEWNLCDGKADPGFVTEYELTLVGWMELPEVVRG